MKYKIIRVKLNPSTILKTEPVYIVSDKVLYEKYNKDVKTFVEDSLDEDGLSGLLKWFKYELDVSDLDLENLLKKEDDVYCQENPIVLPLKVVLPRVTKKDKNVYLNLNTYRNLHYLVNNKVKQIFKDDLKDILTGVVLPKVIRVEYIYYANSNRKSDVSNMCVVVDKFFCDALTYYGCIEEDNYDYVKQVIYTYGGTDKNNGRIEVKIEEYDK